MAEWINKSSNSLYNLVIERDENVGCYLYVKSVSTGLTVKDYLQDSYSECVAQAYEEYGSPIEAWVAS